MGPLRPLVLGAALVGGLLVLAPSPATAARAWAPADVATIHPGVQAVTAGGQCTVNFVFNNPLNPTGSVYVGQAAHCASLDGNTATNGCTARSLPLGTPVEVEGADQLGTLVYSSWLTMQAKGESAPDLCDYNDFALIRLDRRDEAKVNPSMPVWGGPVDLGTATAEGEDVFSVGDSGLRPGLEELGPKTGTSFGQDRSGRTHTVYTATPGIPGDSGSGFLNSTGEAIGVLSTIGVTPLPASNGVSDLSSALAYMQAAAGSGGVPRSFATLRLAPGTEAFDGDATKLLLG